MTGHNVFDQLVNKTTATRNIMTNHIRLEDFELWQRDYIWEALHGQRYGQSFCNRFGITDNLLYYTTWPSEQVDDYIRKTYLARS
jgi:hypothetical protein